MAQHDRGTGIARSLSLKYGRWMAGALLAACLGNATAQTVRWEDYRGDANVGTYTGPAGRPTFANNTGTGADRLNALRAIAANAANAVRTGTAADINYRQTGYNLCHSGIGSASATSCGLQAMGRVSYALIQFPQAGTYNVSIAHDDNVELGFCDGRRDLSWRHGAGRHPDRHWRNHPGLPCRGTDRADAAMPRHRDRGHALMQQARVVRARARRPTHPRVRHPR